MQIREAKSPHLEEIACPKGTLGGCDGFPDAVLDCSHLSRRYTSTATPSPARIHSGGEVTAAWELHGSDTRFVHGAVREVLLTRRLYSRRSSRLPGLPHLHSLLRDDLGCEVGCRHTGRTGVIASGFG